MDNQRLCAISRGRPETVTTVPPRHPCERFIARAPMVPTVGADSKFTPVLALARNCSRLNRIAVSLSVHVSREWPDLIQRLAGLAPKPASTQFWYGRLMSVPDLK
jgi:hypothetical protein